jgi:D-amino-acid dehydrogenase
MSEHVVVIGAGVVGAATAHHCLGEGIKVTLLEPGEPGQPQAASFGNAGWLSPHSILPPSYPGVWKQVPQWLLDSQGPLTVRWRHLPKALPWLRQYLAAGWTYEQIEATSVALRSMLKDAPNLHKEMATDVGVSDLITVREVLHAYPTEQAFENDVRAWKIRQAAGITWKTYKGHALRELEPELSHQYEFGVLVDNTGYCTSPSEYVKALIAHSLEAGATLIRGLATKLNFSGGKVVSITTDTEEIGCDRVIICAGARAKELAAQAGDDIPLATERGYHYVVQALPGRGPNHPTMFMDKKVIVTPMATGLRIAGQVEIAGLDDMPNWQRAQVLRQHLASLYPGLADKIAADQINVWMGRRPSLPDGLACVGFASRGPSVIHAYGHGHVGLAGSARTGRVVAQLLAGKPTEIDLTPFSPQRFKR